MVGIGQFRVSFKDFAGPLQLVIVDGPHPSLLGLDWFASLGLGITSIHSVANSEVEGLIAEFLDVFNSLLGQSTGTPISFSLDPQVAPIHHKPQRVPLALKSKVDEQQDKLIAQGLLEPVDHAK